MEFVRDFFIYNFPLLIISVGMLCVAIYDHKVRKRVCSYIIAIISIALLLAIFLEVEHFGCAINNQVVATLFAFLGYSIRPIVLFLFILLGDGRYLKKRLWLLIPLGINIVIYSLALFLGTPLEKLVYFYTIDEGNVVLTHHRGSILCFTGHLVSFILLAVLIVSSLRKIKTRHSVDSFAILSCSFFVIVAVAIESLTDYSGLLNNAIGVSCVFYYLFMFNEMNRRDALTGLFDRKTFYVDEARFGKDVSGVIHIDVNGLKALNDNIGHEEGDKAIATLGKVIKNSLSKDMYGYRVGGDEFVVLCVNTKEDKIQSVIDMMKKALNETSYSASFGHGMRVSKDDTIDTMLKAAETEMYNDKDLYYKSHNIDRRRH